MTLSEFLARCTTAERTALWEGNASKRVYIYRIAKKKAQPSEEYAKWLSARTGGRVPLHELRPDIWPPPKARGKSRRQDTPWVVPAESQGTPA